MEFMSRDTFYPLLCLIQVAANVGQPNEIVALIDPISAADLRPLWDLIGDESVEKIVHDGREDMKILTQKGVECARNFFDTRIAAQFCGFGMQPGLAALVKEIFGLELDKTHQLSRWDKRPLSPEQKIYAANDVRYLPMLRDNLKSSLQTLKLDSCCEEECTTLCDLMKYRADPQTLYQRVEKWQALKPAQLSILRELAIVREEKASDRNYPRQWAYSDATLVSLARCQTADISILTPFLQTKGRVSEDPTPLIEAISRGLTADPKSLPVVATNPPHASRQKAFTAKLLWSVAESVCYSRGIHPKLVIDETKFVELVVPYITTNGVEHDSPIFRGWRKQLILDPLIAFSKTGQLQLSWHGRELQPTKENETEPKRVEEKEKYDQEKENEQTDSDETK